MKRQVCVIIFIARQYFPTAGSETEVRFTANKHTHTKCTWSFYLSKQHTEVNTLAALKWRLGSLLFPTNILHTRQRLLQFECVCVCVWGAGRAYIHLFSHCAAFSFLLKSFMLISIWFPQTTQLRRLGSICFLFFFNIRKWSLWVIRNIFHLCPVAHLVSWRCPAKNLQRLNKERKQSNMCSCQTHTWPQMFTFS